MSARRRQWRWSEEWEAKALLEFLEAPPLERARMTLEIRQELAIAGLDEATIREYLERGCPEAPDASARLRAELAAARGRVLESARVLLEMRAAAATSAFRV